MPKIIGNFEEGLDSSINVIRELKNESSKPIVISVSGGSCSGKTSLVEEIKKEFGLNLSHIGMDSYYRNGNANTNFDHPDSLELDLALEHIYQLKKGNSIDIPIYNFETHSREGFYTIFPAEIILFEGLFALREGFFKLSDYKIFMTANENLMLKRRIKRDMKERGRTFCSIINQYNKTVKPMYLEFVVPQSQYADLIIENNLQLVNFKN